MKFLTLFNPVSLLSDPPTGNDGDLYYNTNTDTYRIKINGAWTDIVTESILKRSIAPEIFTVGLPPTASLTLTLQSFHVESIINCRSTDLTQIILPDQSESDINIGARIGIMRGGTGVVQVIPQNSSIDLHAPSDIYLTKTNSEIRLINIGYNEWLMTGEFPDIY